MSVLLLTKCLVEFRNMPNLGLVVEVVRRAAETTRPARPPIPVNLAGDSHKNCEVRQSAQVVRIGKRRCRWCRRKVWVLMNVAGGLCVDINVNYVRWAVATTWGGSVYQSNQHVDNISPRRERVACYIGVTH